MRKLLSILFFLPIFCGAQITLTVTLTGATRASSTIAPVKYNKQSVFMYEVDDRLPSMRQAYAVMHGGTDPFTGKNYPGYTFTDGCGNTVGYRAGFAVNIVSSGTTQDLETTGGSTPTTAFLSWAEIKSLIASDFCPSAHGWQHNETSGWPGAVQNIDRCVKATYDSTLRLGLPFVLRTWITPNADAGYSPAAEQQRFLAGTSTNDLDGYPSYPSFNATNNFTTVATLNKWGYVFEKRDYTGNNCRFSDVSYFDSKIDNLLAQSSLTNRTVMRFFSHQIDSVDGFNAIISHLKTVSNDRTWVASAHEVFEYWEATRRYIKKETFSAGKLVITLDDSYFSPDSRYRDLSLNISTDGTIASVAVSGADSYSWSNANKLINVFKKKTSGFTRPSLIFTENAPFILNADGFYSNNPSGSYAQLYDGDVQNYATVHSSLVRGQDQIFYEFPDSAGVILRSFSVFNGHNSSFAPATQFYAERKVDGQWIFLGSFDNTQAQNTWTTFTPQNTFVATRVIAVAGRAGSVVGTEWKVTCDRINYNEQTSFPARVRPRMERVAGVNVFPWDLYDNGRSQTNHPRYDELAHFNFQRLYLDRYQVHITPREMAFSPTAQGFNLDSSLFQNSSRGITTLICLKDTVQYEPTGWPNDFWGYHPPRPYGSDGTDPASYLNFGWECFQLGARFGAVTTIPLSKIHIYTSGPFYTVNVPRVGLNYNIALEPFNEPDVFWKPQDYMTGDEIAAMLSACYDGDMGRLGDTVGVKTASPSIKVFFSGLAIPSPEAVRMAIAWSKLHRGYRPDGSANVPWDALNYHDYSNDGSGQHTQATRGLPVELSGTLKNAAAFVHVSDKYLRGMEVYNTETNYDTCHLSVLGVPSAIGSRNEVQTQADWMIRAFHAYVATGLSGVSLYRSTDDIGGWEDHAAVTTTLLPGVWTTLPLATGEGTRFTDSTWIWLELNNAGTKNVIFRAAPQDADHIKVYNWGTLIATVVGGDLLRGPYYLPTQFNSMGVLNGDESPRTVRYFVEQLNTLLNGYTYSDSLAAGLYHYQKSGASDMYVGWSETASALSRSLSFATPVGSTIVSHHLTDNSGNFTSSGASTSGNSFTFSASETPVYVEVIFPAGPPPPPPIILPSGMPASPPPYGRYIRIYKFHRIKIH